MDLCPLSLVGWGLNASGWNDARHKGSVVSVAPLRSLLLSVQLKWTKSAPKHSSKQLCCLNWQQPERDLPIGPERLLWKGLWQNHGPFKLRSRGAHRHTFPPRALLEIFQEEDVRNQSLPKALMTSRDCWRIYFDSWMWQSPLQQKLQERERAVEQLTKSASLSSYHFWKLNNLPCKQNTAHVYSAKSAPQHHKILETPSCASYRSGTDRLTCTRHW